MRKGNPLLAEQETRMAFLFQSNVIIIQQQTKVRKTFGKLRFLDILEHCVLVGGGEGGGGPPIGC